MAKAVEEASAEIEYTTSLFLFDDISCGLHAYHQVYDLIDSSEILGDSLPAAPANARQSLWLLVGLIVLTISSVWMSRAIWFAREAARQSQCQGNLNQISMAFYNYHDAYGSFPPAYVADASGKPMHSWRVLILPFIDEKELYEKYDFSEPWNGPQNSHLKIPEYLFHCPSGKLGKDSSMTEYVVVTGSKTPFPGPTATTRGQFKDGRENTILLVEITNSDIHWMEPRDLDFDSMSFQVNDVDQPSISAPHPLGPVVVFADGITGYRLDDSVSPKTLQGLVTISGGEQIRREQFLKETNGLGRQLAEPLVR